jgi:hypothetical protein
LSWSKFLSLFWSNFPLCFDGYRVLSVPETQEMTILLMFVNDNRRNIPNLFCIQKHVLYLMLPFHEIFVLNKHYVSDNLPVPR